VAWTTGGGNAIQDFQKDNPSLKGKVVPSPALDTPPLYVQGLSVSAKTRTRRPRSRWPGSSPTRRTRPRSPRW